MGKVSASSTSFLRVVTSYFWAPSCVVGDHRDRLSRRYWSTRCHVTAMILQRPQRQNSKSSPNRTDGM